MKSSVYVKNEGVGSALQASSVSKLHLCLGSHNRIAVSRLPTVLIVSRDVGVAYAMQDDLAEPALLSLVIEMPSKLGRLGRSACMSVAL